MSVRKDRNRQLTTGLLLTLCLGLLFLLCQTFNWIEIWRAVAAAQHRSQFMTTFYILTGLHAAHVLGGLIPLAIVSMKAMRHRYSRNFYPGVRIAPSTGTSSMPPGWSFLFPCF